MKTSHKSMLLVALTATFVFMLSAAAVANAQGGPGGSQGRGSGAGVAATPLSATEIDALNRVLQDEYHAEAVYAQVVADFDDAVLFAHIQQAETRHAAAVERLFARYNLQLPENQWAGVDFPAFENIEAACAAGVEAESDNAGLYDWALSNTTKRDLTNVFTNLKTASLESHLPAFEACDPDAIPAGDGLRNGWNSDRPTMPAHGWQNRPATPPRWNRSAGQ